MLAKVLVTALIGGAVLMAFSTPEDRGKELFGRRCSGCHAADLNKEGPRLRGVYGRHAARVPGFAYSEALKTADIRWDDATLDRWLTDPDVMAPDTDMAFRLGDGEERKAVIAYLKSLGNHDGEAAISKK
ncbi:MAG: c-type cytochrome [Bryobacteraceae bacterium]